MNKDNIQKNEINTSPEIEMCEPASSKKTTLILSAALIIGAISVLVGYTLYTHHIWEDFFITFRCSQNLAEGNGLVYEVGRRVHTFTSPLGVLLPALTYLLSGSKSYVGAIWLFRILFCIPAFIGGGFFILKLYSENYKKTQLSEKKPLIHLLPVIFILLFYLFDVKSVMYTMNGMETGIMLFFFMWALYLLQKGIIKQWLITGVVWGGMMWTRPDSCFYIAALMLTSLLFSSNSRSDTPKQTTISDRKNTVIAIIKASLITAIIYLPWFLWAWWYYGSPVPNTVLAKSAVNSISLSHFLSSIVTQPSWAFSQVYGQFIQNSSAAYFSIIMTLFASLYWLIKPLNDQFGKKLSFTYFLLSLYFALMPFPYPWYFPPLTILGYIIIVNGIWQILKNVKNVAIYATTAYIALFLNIILQFSLTTYQMKMQQEIIENGLRKPIGQWLKENTKPTDTIFLEPLGYIGYFSERKMIDYPGLSSPEVVKLIKEKHCTFETLIPELKPNWVIVRPFRIKGLEQTKGFISHYKYVAHFSALQQIKKAGYIQGQGYLDYDSVFVLYKRK